MTPPPGWEWFSDWLLKSSGQAAVLIVLVLVIQWACRGRLPARWRHVLWWIVIARLLVPLFVPGPVSVFNWVHWPNASSLSLSRPGFIETSLPNPEVEALSLIH